MTLALLYLRPSCRCERGGDGRPAGRAGRGVRVRHRRQLLGLPCLLPQTLPEVPL